MAINKPAVSASAVDESGKLTQVFFRLITSIVDFINSAPKTLDYAGNPEGNLIGNYKDTCWDTVNNKLYFKSTTTGDAGWIAIN
jgi:hypothetical protein